MKQIFKKPFIILLLVGVLLRLLLLPITFHQDLLGHLFSGSFFSQNNIFNVYDHLASLPQNHPLVTNFGVEDIFIYPPLAYFTFGIFQKILSPLINWDFVYQLMQGISVYQPQLPWLLFVTKLPYLFIDIFLGWTLTRLFSDLKKKKLIFALWMFNPVTLYATAAMGVFDVIPTLLTVLAAVYLKEKKAYLSLLMLGFGAAFKSYPLFLIPIVVLGTQGNLWTKIKLGFTGIAPYLISFIPFWQSSAFRHMVFSPKSQKMLFMSLPVSGAEGIFPFIWASVLIYLLAAKRQDLQKRFYQYFLVFFLVLFSVTHYHPQWFLWLSPFLLIELVDTKFKNFWLLSALFAIYVFITFTFDPSLNLGLFGVIIPGVREFPGLTNLLTSKTDVNMFKSLARSVFASLATYLSLISLFNFKTKKTN